LPTSSDPLLQVEGLSKGFGGAQALAGAELTVMPGEVHGLLGENGSGKSTLIKVLAGVHAPESGRLRLSGRDVALPLRPGDGRRLGLSFVHQELGLIDSLSVLDNMRIADFAVGGRGRRWYIPWRRERRALADTFERYGLAVRPEAPVATLPPLERALIAIVRAVEGLPRDAEGRPRGLLVLDEPTVFLPRDEVETLFGLVRTIAAAGGSVLFVSHDLDEVREITDRVTVLRDGRTVGSAETRATSPERLVEMIIGHRLASLAAGAKRTPSGERSVSIEGLRGPGVNGVSFGLDGGEVLGLTGLLGSGFEATPYLLFDDVAGVEGTLRIGERAYEIGALTPHRALEAGIALLPGDRREAGVASLTLSDNLMLPVLDDYERGGVLRRGEMRRQTLSLLRDCDVRPLDPAAKLQALSGGNQQKALLGKWIGGELRLMLVHEPTQGVDVGAREQITGLLRERAAAGMPIVCAGSDYEQLALLCDRVLVFGNGEVVEELSGPQVTKERITDSCLRSVSAGAAMAQAPRAVLE
jgi:ribose transport system ATP-binding protein